MDEYKSFFKEKRFEDFSRSVQRCSICPRLSHRTKVLTELNGNLSSKVLFVAEAPGRLGADRTGIPLCGDRTGDIFESLIESIGWERDQIFITNAVLCNPRKKNGNNGTPTTEEIFNCSTYLEMTINLIQPDVIVPLGITALTGLSCIHPYSLKLRDNVARLISWNNMYLFPLYHPSPRALIHRSLKMQRSDYKKLSTLVAPVKGLKKAKTQKTVSYTPLLEIAEIFIKELHELSFFKLTKLLYLTDLAAIRELGRTLSGEIYLRQQEGPWLPKLKETLKSVQGNKLEVRFRNRIPFVSIGANFALEITFDEEALRLILNVLKKYGNMNDAKLKSTAYLSAPMRYILKQEKAGRDMKRVPVIYKDKMVMDLDNNKL